MFGTDGAQLIIGLGPECRTVTRGKQNRVLVDLTHGSHAESEPSAGRPGCMLRPLGTRRRRARHCPPLWLRGPRVQGTMSWLESQHSSEERGGGEGAAFLSLPKGPGGGDRSSRAAAWASGHQARDPLGSRLSLPCQALAKLPVAENNATALCWGLQLSGGSGLCF